MLAGSIALTPVKTYAKDGSMGVMGALLVLFFIALSGKWR